MSIGIAICYANFAFLPFCFSCPTLIKILQCFLIKSFGVQRKILETVARTSKGKSKNASRQLYTACSSIITVE